MITLTELIQFMSLLISVAGLFYLIGKDNHGKKKYPPQSKVAVIFLTKTPG